MCVEHLMMVSHGVSVGRQRKKRRGSSLGGLGVAVAAVILGAGVIAPATARTPLALSIDHVVVIVQENHSFDSYFATYCLATKTCNVDAAVKNPYSPIAPMPLTDATTMVNDPNHEQACELAEIDGGKMDGYITPNPAASQASGLPCGAPVNFAEAPNGTGPVARYQAWAARGGLADNYFQPIAGASSSNDMYLWSAHYEFTDNTVEPDAIGKQCSTNSNVKRYNDVAPGHANLGELLDRAHVGWAWYAEGYDAMTKAGSGCPLPPTDCAAHVPMYPCVFDPSDLPPEYYASSADNPAHIHDFKRLGADIRSGRLPSVTFVKGIGYRSEHPGYGTTLGAGVDFVQRTVDEVESNPAAAAHTLILITWDESGGYFDHVSPPAPVERYPGTATPVPYGPRVPLLALGAGVRAGQVSHVQLEHSSIPAFIEWRWLGRTGQLGGRDAVVHNLGSLLDPRLHVPN